MLKANGKLSAFNKTDNARKLSVDDEEIKENELI